MDFAEISDAWQHAKNLHSRMPVKDRPSVDAVFVAVCARGAKPFNQLRQTASAVPGEVPQWFADAVNNLGGMHATASAIWRDVAKEEPTPAQSRQCGIWLRGLGYEARKSSGRLLFMIQQKKCPPAPL